MCITYANIIAKLRQRCARRVGHERVVCSYCFGRISRSRERAGLMAGGIDLLLCIDRREKGVRLSSGPAQKERSVGKQEIGAAFPEELKTHSEGEAQRVLE